jgi:pimeloyl-ACP methyl ester carboxylesterase
MPRPSPGLWAIRTAFRTLGAVAPRIVWDDLHIPTVVRELPAAALVIHDGDDPDVPFAHREEIVDAWAGSRLESTSGLGHRALLRDPAVIGRTVEFLRGGTPG